MGFLLMAATSCLYTTLYVHTHTHMRVRIHTLPCVSVTHPELGEAETQGEREMDGGIRDRKGMKWRSFRRSLSVISSSLFLFVYIADIPVGIVDDCFGH